MTSDKPKRARAPKIAAESNPKSKRERKSSPTTFTGRLRELVQKHRAKLKKLTDLEDKFARKLDIVRAQREAAEGPLRQVEEMLYGRPELPGLEPEAEADQPDAAAPIAEEAAAE